MKLNKIYISAFGGLKDFTLNLNDGLNVIFGNNEDGKTTVATFIKCMFYGTGTKKANLAESIRQKYTPWDGSAMAGRIEFEHEGKRYSLEKIFRSSDSTDKVTVTDLDSGNEVKISGSVGQHFFGFSDKAFERSLFISGGDFIKDNDATGEINGKLSNIAFTGSEDVSFTKVEKNIDTPREKIISVNKKSGSYNKDLQTLGELEARLANAENDAKLKSQLNDRAQQKLAEYELLNKKQKELKTIVDREQDIKNRESLAEFLETKRSLDKLNESLTLPDGTVINENLTGKIEFGLNKYKTSLDRIEQIKEDINGINETIALQNSSPEATKQQLEDLKAQAKTVEEQKAKYDALEENLIARVEQFKQELDKAQNKKAAVNPLLLVLAIILAASGGALAFFVSVIAAAAAIGVAVLLLILSFVIKPKNTSAIAAAQNNLATATNALAENKSAKNTAQEQLNNINASINTLNSVLQADNTIKQQCLDDLAKKQELLQAELEKSNLAKDELFALLSGFGGIDSIDTAQQKLLELKQKTEQVKEIKLKLMTASQFLGNIDYDEAEKKLADMNTSADQDVDIDSAKAEYQDVTDKISAIKDEITSIATELKTSFRHSENPEEVKRDIELLKEKMESKKAFYDAATIAKEVLKESFYELRRGYGSELEKATLDIFSNLTGGRYNNIRVTDTLDLSVEKSDIFGTHELGFLSVGTTHQAYLSLRLAIASLVSDGESLPIFLDDSLSQYDDTRAEHAMEFLKEFCKNGQGVLFTCHNSICDIAKKQDVEIQTPYKK